MNKNKLALILGNVSSKIGNLAYSTILSLWILDVFNDYKILGEIKTYQYIVMIVLNLFSGHISDKYSRKYILILLDFFSGIFCIFFYISGLGDVNNLLFYNLLILNIILIINSTCFSVTLRAIIPEIIETTEIKTFNSILTALGEILKLLIPPITIILYKNKILGFYTILIFNGLTFLISSIFESFIEYNFNKNIKLRKKNKFIKEFKEGFKLIYLNKQLLFLLVYAAYFNIFNSILELLIPYYFNNIAISPYYLSLTYILEAISGILSSLIIIKYNNKNILTFKILILMQIIPFMFLIIPTKFFFTVSIFLITSIGVLFNILFFSYIQKNIEKQVLGRVFSVVFFISGLGIPLGSFIFSRLFINYYFGINVLVFCGILSFIFFYTMYKYFFKGCDL